MLYKYIALLSIRCKNLVKPVKPEKVREVSQQLKSVLRAGIQGHGPTLRDIVAQKPRRRNKVDLKLENKTAVIVFIKGHNI